MILNNFYFLFRVFQAWNSKEDFFISLAVQFNSDIGLNVVLKILFTELQNHPVLFERRQSILSLLEQIYFGEKFKLIE
jgi:hypothetical protein